MRIFKTMRGFVTLRVPKTLSALMSRGNRLTSSDHDRAAMFRNGRRGCAIQVEEPAAMSAASVAVHPA
jgi:hypothetical protein